MSTQIIPADIKKQVNEIITGFNQKIFKGYDCCYIARYRSAFLYLERYDSGIKSQICRLRYKGKIDNWEFAIFKYSDERYDPDEWMFPGSGLVDGTIEGAMKAGLKAYP